MKVSKSIIHYKISMEDLSIDNPYLKKIQKLLLDNSHLSEEELSKMLCNLRFDFVSDYSFTIPYYEILQRISSYSPIVEIGAGSGYWARCLSILGADIIAYDRFPPGENHFWEWEKSNSWFDDSWYHIIEGDESMAGFHPDRTLFMAWPMPMNPMAYNALLAYKNAKGKKVIYIGHPHPASSGDENFYELLFTQKKIYETTLFGWPDIEEKLLIYEI